jgi:hypothetical protein
MDRDRIVDSVPDDASGIRGDRARIPDVSLANPKRGRLAAFLLGFLAGVLFMVLFGGAAVSTLVFPLYYHAEHQREHELVEHERALAAEEEAVMQRERAEESVQRERMERERALMAEKQAMQQLERAEEARRIAEEARREFERRDKP